MKKYSKVFFTVPVLIFALAVTLSSPVLASSEDALLTLDESFTDVEIGTHLSNPYDSAKQESIAPESLMFYVATAKDGSPIVTNQDALVTKISLVNDASEKKVMILKYGEGLYVNLYYSFQSEYQVGEIIPSGKTIAKYSSENENLLVLEVLKDGQRQLIKDYIEI